MMTSRSILKLKLIAEVSNIDTGEKQQLELGRSRTIIISDFIMDDTNSPDVQTMLDEAASGMYRILALET